MVIVIKSAARGGVTARSTSRACMVRACLSDQKHGKKEGPWAEDRVRGNKRTEKAEGGTCIDPELEAGANTRQDRASQERAMNTKKSGVCAAG